MPGRVRHMLKRTWERVRALPGVQTTMDVGTRYERDGGPYLSSAIAYHGFLSFFPLILLALSAIGFFLDSPVARSVWIGRLTDVLPGLGEEIGGLVGGIVNGRAGTGIVGLVGLVWTGTSVVEASRFAMGRIFPVGPRPSFLRRKAIAVGIMLLLGPLGLGGAVLTALVAGVEASGLGGLVLRILGWVGVAAIAVGLFALSYRVLIRRPGAAWRDLLPGAALGAGGWVLIQMLGALYVSRVVARASAVYGSLAAIIGLLILLHLGARLFLYGAVLIAHLMDRRGFRS